MKIKDSRALSFTAVAVIYIIAAMIGIVTYLALRYDFWLSLLIADSLSTVFTFICSLIFCNASVYDPYWSVAPPVILTAFAFGAELNVARILMLVAVWFWAVRLTANWAYTFRGLRHQDWRYTMLCCKTGVFYPIINFIGIHMVPTLVVYGCVLPAVFLFRYDTGWNAGSIVFFALSIGALILQAVSDIQMQSFRKKKCGVFIRRGLWRYSRHPNYLGEILMWWGIALAALSVMPERWYLCAGAVANTLLFLCVSIPMADTRQSKKPGFERYKKETRLLLPIRR